MVRVWSLETGELIATLKGHTFEIVIQVAFSPDGKHLASRARPFFDGQKWPDLGEIRIWDLDARKAIVSIDKVCFAALALPVVFSPDGKRLASGAGEQALKVWDTASGHELLVKELGNRVGAAVQV
jgi:WD40 repeat protein